MCLVLHRSQKRSVLKACFRFILKNKLVTCSAADLIDALQYGCGQVHEGTTQNKDPSDSVTGAWVLLEALLAEDLMLPPTDQVLQSKYSAIVAYASALWLNKRSSATTTTTTCYSPDDNDSLILEVMCHLHEHDVDENVSAVCQHLERDMGSLMRSHCYIASAVDLVYAVHTSKRTSNGILQCRLMCGQLLCVAYDTLHQFVLGNISTRGLFGGQRSSPAPQAGTDAVASAVFIVGAVSMLGFHVEEEESRFTLIDDSESTLPAYFLGDDGSAFRLAVPLEITALLKLLMPNTLPPIKGNSTAVRITPTSIRAHAFLTMGKLCIRDKSLAKEFLNVFLRELRQTAGTSAEDNEAVRSNALIVLGDICVRHTHIVDRHIGTLAACLQDRSSAVKMNALVILSQLILQDYIKWKGLLLFRFVACAADDDEDFAEFATGVVRNSILNKFPDFFTSRITESILLFNGCTRHPILQSLLHADMEATAVSGFSHLEGPQHQQRRYELYLTFLYELKDEDKLLMTTKLLNDILVDVVDHPARLGTEARHGHMTAMEHALEDVLFLLQSHELKVGKSAATNNEDEVIPEDDVTSTQQVEKREVVAKAKAKVSESCSSSTTVHV
jgi:hypothetical protein